MTVAQSRVVRVAAWVAAVIGVVLLVLTFVLPEYSYGFHPDLLLVLMYPVPAVWWWRCWRARWWPAAWCMPA